MTASRIYVAGASGDMARARKAMDEVYKIGGLVLTSDWVRVITEHGSANLGLSEEVRSQESSSALAAVETADILWLLCPTVPTVGAWVELGAFLGAKKSAVVVSGGDPEISIFTAQAERLFRTDEEAARYLRASYSGE
jgi:hypothetical protein